MQITQFILDFIQKIYSLWPTRTFNAISNGFCGNVWTNIVVRAMSNTTNCDWSLLSHYFVLFFLTILRKHSRTCYDQTDTWRYLAELSMERILNGCPENGICLSVKYWFIFEQFAIFSWKKTLFFRKIPKLQITIDISIFHQFTDSCYAQIRNN